MNLKKYAIFFLSICFCNIFAAEYCDKSKSSCQQKCLEIHNYLDSKKNDLKKYASLMQKAKEARCIQRVKRFEHVNFLKKHNKKEPVVGQSSNQAIIQIADKYKVLNICDDFGSSNIKQIENEKIELGFFQSRNQFEKETGTFLSAFGDIAANPDVGVQSVTPVCYKKNSGKLSRLINLAPEQGIYTINKGYKLYPGDIERIACKPKQGTSRECVLITVNRYQLNKYNINNGNVFESTLGNPNTLNQSYINNFIKSSDLVYPQNIKRLN